MASSDDPSLKRSLGLKDALFFGIGTMLGAGIYAIIGAAAGEAGNMLWLSFLIAAGAAMLSAFSYAEFVSRFPDAGGSFEYIKQSIGPAAANVAGVLISFTGIVAAAAIAISFADYLSRLVDIPSWIGVVSIIALMGIINVIGVQSSSWFNAAATVSTLLGLLFVVVVSIGDWGTVDLLAAPDGFPGVAAASALIFFSFVGFEDLVKMAEETKDPRSTLPKAVLISSFVVLVIYILVAISAVSVIGWQELSESNGPLSAVIKSKVGQVGATILTCVALFATSKTILSNILGTSRLLFDMARDTEASWLKKLTHVVEKFGTPVFAILLVTVVSIGFGLIGNLKVVASISNVCIISVFLTVNACMIVWRLRNRDAAPAPFTIPGSIAGAPILPVLGVLATGTLLYFNLTNILNG